MVTSDTTHTHIERWGYFKAFSTVRYSKILWDNLFFFFLCEIFMLFSVNIHEQTLPCFFFFLSYQRPRAGLAPLIIEAVGHSTRVRGGVQHEGHLPVCVCVWEIACVRACVWECMGNSKQPQGSEFKGQRTFLISALGNFSAERVTGLPACCGARWKSETCIFCALIQLCISFPAHVPQVCRKKTSP